MSNILFVFEGARKEGQVADNFLKCFPENNDIVIQCAHCTTIYNLYNKISRDEDLDTFSVLKENPNNTEILAPYSRKDFAEVYLFFDYDGHTSSANDEKLIKALNFFDEETDFGKLYINYPMVESLKHYSDSLNFKELTVCAKRNINYKKIVNKQCSSIYIDFNLYTKDIWNILINAHLKKMNYILTDSFSIPSDIVSQEKIFLKQMEKYILFNSTVAVLNSFPIFLFEYFGSSVILE